MSVSEVRGSGQHKAQLDILQNKGGTNESHFHTKIGADGCSNWLKNLEVCECGTKRSSHQKDSVD